MARPGGNATGINFFSLEVNAKRLGLLHELVPKAIRIAVLVNPANALTGETTLQEISKAARSHVGRTDFGWTAPPISEREFSIGTPGSVCHLLLAMLQRYAASVSRWQGTLNVDV